MAILSVGVVKNPAFLDFQTERYKEMGKIMASHPDSRIQRTTWTPLSRIDVIGNDNANLWGYNEHPRGSYKIITQDGSAHTRLLSKRALDKLRAEVENKDDGHIFNMVYEVKESPEVAVVGVGGGIDVAYALAYGAPKVTGIELNPAIFKYARNEFADYTGHLLDDPKVKLLNQEGRSALRSINDKFDVVQINAIDTFAALSSGAYVLSESNLYTVEAFEDIFDRLKDDGILSIHRWVFLPPRESLRISVLACEALKRRGIKDTDHNIMVVRRNKWAVTLIKRTPFTESEIAAVRKRSDDTNCQILYWPKVFSADRQAEIEGRYLAALPDDVRQAASAFDQCIASYQTGTEDRFLASYLYNVTPTTSDSPFFFEYNFRNAFGLPRTNDNLRDTLRVDASTSIYLILVQSTVFIVLAVFWPLWKFHRKGTKFQGSLSWSVYFGAIGLSFMIVEIAIIQKCVLFLGNPMYSLSVVLASILVSAGLGSAWFGRSGWTLSRVVCQLGAVLVGTLLFAAVAMTPFFTLLLHLPLVVRMIVVLAVTFPIGFQMGVFFPAGLQMIRNREPQFVPWAWGINGCASVYGSIVAILIAIVHGFNASLLVGASTYVLGFVVMYLGVLRRRGTLGFFTAPKDTNESSNEECSLGSATRRRAPGERPSAGAGLGRKREAMGDAKDANTRPLHRQFYKS